MSFFDTRTPHRSSIDVYLFLACIYSECKSSHVIWYSLPLYAITNKTNTNVQRPHVFLYFQYNCGLNLCWGSDWKFGCYRYNYIINCLLCKEVKPVYRCYHPSYYKWCKYYTIVPAATTARYNSILILVQIIINEFQLDLISITPTKMMSLRQMSAMLEPIQHLLKILYICCAYPVMS